MCAYSFVNVIHSNSPSSGYYHTATPPFVDHVYFPSITIEGKTTGTRSCGSEVHTNYSY